MSERDLHRAAAATWAHRARMERESTVRFARLAPRLAAVGADRAVVDLARTAADDEARHARLCAETAALFGAPPDAAGEVRVPEIAPPALPLRDRVLYEVAAFCCIAETLNASLLTATLDVTRHEAVRRTVHALLRDEVTHSRLGWAHLAWEHARGNVTSLGELVPRMLDGTVADELFAEDDAALDPERLRAQGNLPRSARRALFRGTLEDVVLPGFEAYGVATEPARAWLARRLPG